jgi:hyperosmotically inducible periplasmic protein
MGALLPLAVAATLQGCAVGLLKGASSSGGSASGSGTPPRTSAPSPTPASSAAKLAADNAISNSVRSRISANSALKGLNIYVDTHDGVVTLRGQVVRVEQKSAAEANARSVQGVRSVQNLLTVR